MKRTVVLVLVVVLVLSVLPEAVLPVRAQDDDCDPAAVETWLIERQSWLNALTDVLNQFMLRDQRQENVFWILENIEALPRPGCMDEMMLWTYYAFASIQRYIECDGSGDVQCMARIQERSEIQRAATDAIMAEHSFDREAYLDQRPDGWLLSDEGNG